MDKKSASSLPYHNFAAGGIIIQDHISKYVSFHNPIIRHKYHLQFLCPNIKGKHTYKSGVYIDLSPAMTEMMAMWCLSLVLFLSGE